MKKNDLLRYDSNILRVISILDSSVMVVDCLRKSMPKWMDKSQLAEFTPCSEQELPIIPHYEELDRHRQKIAHERFTMIASILAVVADETARSSMLSYISEEYHISKQTLRSYLWRYLVYQDISVLAPKGKAQARPLTPDEKNMRWALNKFFYTQHKNTLTSAYTLMLKEKYCDDCGVLFAEYPTIHQFRYFYKKHRKMETYLISRKGIKHYQRNCRPLLGDGVQQFAPHIGTAMLDSTICDIYLVDDSGSLVGRPILTACIDAYSSLCCGYFLSWQGGVYSLRGLMLNVIANKVEWCSRFGICITQEDWNCIQLPAVLVTDKGAEYQSYTFEQLAELGIKIINLPSFQPELKGQVEKFFDLIQTSYKPYLKGKGVIEPDFQERGAKDYRKEACLTMRDFEKIVLHCILHYNTKRIIEQFPFTKDMFDHQVQPLASSIWNWGLQQPEANLISVERDTLLLTLLPRTTGRFSRTGLKVNNLRYRNDDYTEQYLQGGTAAVSYNPDDVSNVWLHDNGIYVRFRLAENRFNGATQPEAEQIRTDQKAREKALQHSLVQAKIDLANHIEAIASAVTSPEDVNIKHIRRTRSKEQSREHTDFMKGDI